MPRLVWCALVALVLLLCGCNTPQDPASPRAEPPRAVEPPREHAPVVFVLGDSYTAGIRAVPAEQTYAAETARRLGWQVVIAGHSGTGFVTRGRVGMDFGALFEAQLSWRPAPDLIVISGGHNDQHTRTLPQVGAAADRLLRAVKAHWPETHVVLMGPLWGGTPPPAALRVRDALRGTARGLRVPFVDPLVEPWITGHFKKNGNARRFVMSDGTHFNAAGHRHVAERFVAELRRLGLERPALGRPATRRKPAQNGMERP
ncbi:SGNH/GDSL hydrolase family protein [Thermomonospora umbrina]|uniref:Lysophospholipase L1-like esterase n=1 Tax=Thermomonospora umbrina TaxID=111806 RepID=A0A3D9SKQ6_9ACTN|nr:SGNH/GDSL hydrolase family protein [Thermomonospora umbrina]REE96499.1 lysophospholipase L1-like esterase [Thermomonospora umbrina]